MSMRVFKILSMVLVLAALPVAADNAFEPASAGGVGYPPDPGAPVWSGPRAILYDNGPLVNQPGAGAGGADASALQTTLGMNTLGAGHQFALGYSMADDFTVPAGETWDITNITFFAYQTGSTTTSTMTGVYLQIWNGAPNGGGSVVFGDLTTNRLGSTAWSNIYRVTDTTLTTTGRPVMASVADVVTTLTEGTYWLQWSTDGSLSSGPWAPPITINGQTTTGNALQFTTSWGPFLDSGTAAAQQGLPFIIEGTSQGSGGGGGGGGGGGTGATAEPIPTLSNSGLAILVLALIGIAAVLIRRRM